MKILKKIGIFLVALFLLIVIIDIFLPGKVVVTRSKVIAAPKDVLFSMTGDLKNWNKWSPWYKLDTTAVYTFSEPTTGKGAFYTWKGNKKVGEGKLTITDVSGTDSVNFDLDFKDRGHGLSTFRYLPKEGGTEVVWSMQSELPFLFRIMGLFMDGMLGKDFDAGLNNMEAVAKEMPAETVETFPVIETEAKVYLVIKDSASGQAISAKFGELYGKIGACLKENKMDFTGPVGAFYYKNTEEMMVFEAAVPVAAVPAKLCKGVEVKKVPAQKVVAYDYYGDYMNMYMAHEKMKAFIASNKMEAYLPTFEEYVTDPMMEKDTAKWLSKIYIPVK